MGSPVPHHLLMNKITSLLPGPYQQFRARWRDTPAASKTIESMTQRLIAEEELIKCYTQPEPRSNIEAYVANGILFPFQDSHTEPVVYYGFSHLDQLHRSHNVYKSDSRKAGHQSGKGGYPGTRENSRGNTHGVSSGRVERRGGYSAAAATTTASKVWRCLFHENDTHDTIDCRTMKRARERNLEQRRNSSTQHHQSFAASSHREQDPSSTSKEGDEEMHDESYSAAHTLPIRSVFDWYADSGSTKTVTDMRHLIMDYQSVRPGSWTISGIGGIKLNVHGYGNVPVIAEVIQSKKKKKKKKKNFPY